jgi:hypothetical protein
MKTGLCKQAVANYTQYFQQLVEEDLEPVRKKIGGPGIIVEIDETKMGRRKYNRGHRVEGAWVLGGVERTPSKRIFLVEFPDRTAASLLKAIKKYVKKRTA